MRIERRDAGVDEELRLLARNHLIVEEIAADAWLCEEAVERVEIRRRQRPQVEASRAEIMRVHGLLQPGV